MPSLNSGAAYAYSMCDNCNHVVMCGMRAIVRDRIVTNVESWPGHPRGPLCAKGYALMQQLYHPKRLLHPYKRTTPKDAPDPGFARISWEEAYCLIAANLSRIRAEYGAHSVFFYCGGLKEPRPAVQRLAALYGSPNYGTESSTACMRASVFADWLTFGAPLLNRMPNADTRVMLLWGVNPAAAHHTYLPGLKAARQAGARCIVIDPRATATAALFADIHLRPRLGATAALAAGMARAALVEGWHDEAFCRAQIHGFEEYSRYVRDFTPELTESLTNVPAKDMLAAVRLYAKNRPRAFSSSAQSTTHDRNGIANHRGIGLFAALFGDIQPPRPDAPLSLPKGADLWANGGPQDFGLHKMLALGKEQRIDAKRVPAWADWAWEVNTSYLPEAIAAKEIRALVAFGLNVMIWPQSDEYAKAFGDLEFSMAVDYFHRPRSHRTLDLLLPAAVNFERRAPFGMFGRELYGRTALPPQGEAREDWRIALEIGGRLGYAEECFHGNPEAACNSILARWNLSYADLDNALAHGTGITLPPEYFQPDPPQQAVLRRSPAFATATGKIEAVSTHLEAHGLPGLPEFAPPCPTSPEYPFQLLSGTRRPHMTHSRTRQDTPWLFELDANPEVEINPVDAGRLNIKSREWVDVRSAFGALRACAHVTPEMPEGMVGMMHGWAAANANDLVPRVFDPASGYAPLKEIPVSVKPAAGPRPGNQYVSLKELP